MKSQLSNWNCEACAVPTLAFYPSNGTLIANPSYYSDLICLILTCGIETGLRKPHEVYSLVKKNRFSTFASLGLFACCSCLRDAK